MTDPATHFVIGQSPRDMVIGRVITFARPTFILSLIATICAAISHGQWSQVFAAAVVGMLSAAMIKLFCIVTFTTVGIAFVVTSWSKIRFVVWPVTKMAELAFDLLNGALGIFLGIATAFLFLGPRSVALSAFMAAVLAVVGQTAYVGLSHALASESSHLFAKRPVPRLLVGVFLCIVGVATMMHEPWQEVGVSTPTQAASAKACAAPLPGEAAAPSPKP
jgi:hypothetical protein